MKNVKKADARIFKNSDKCIAYEYPTKEKNLNMTVIDIEGRYPEEGQVVNKVCKEIIYVAQGSGKIVVEGKELELNAGDQVFINAGEKFYYSDCQFRLIVSCAPAYYPEQHIQVDC